MANNFLEQLLSEWYEYQGYFLRRNVKVGKLSHGGWEGELDVVAFHPKLNHLLHIESSTDANSWPEREQRFKRKFEAGAKYIPSLFEGMVLPGEIDRRAVFAFCSTKNYQFVGGGRVYPIQEVLREIVEKFRTLPPNKAAVPEHHAILRTLQFAACHRTIFDEPEEVMAPAVGCALK